MWGASYCSATQKILEPSRFRDSTTIRYTGGDGGRWSLKSLRWAVRLDHENDRAMTTMPRAIFPAPDHDHERCASAGIAHAEAHCAARAQRLTPMRRQVLETLLASHKPLGAYEIIECMAD